MRRPSNREIDRRLQEAKLALKNRLVEFSNPSKVVGELMALDLGDSDEVWDLILKLLDEIKLENYAGQYPPKINYEPEGKGLDLWAFTWNSARLNKFMYLKFSIGDGCFYYVSLHESRSHIEKEKKYEMPKM